MAEPTTRPDIVEQAAQTICDAYEAYAPVPAVLRSEAPNISRALADAGLLADPEQQRRLDRYIEAFQEQTTELEELRAAFEQEKHDSAWVLARVRRNLGTPDGRAVSVHAAEVRKERDTWEAEYERVRDLKLTDLADALAERDLALWLHAEAKWWLDQYMHDVVTWRKQLLETNGELLTTQAERDALQARVDAALALHTEVLVFQPCGHEHDGSEAGVVWADEIGSVCQDGYQYSICRACCCDGPDGDHGQHEVCADEHCPGEKPNLCWPCPTRRALKPAEPGGSETGGNAAEPEVDR